MRIAYAVMYTTILLLGACLFGMIINSATSTIAKVLSKAFGYKTAMFIMNYATFIGVVHHELSHALFAFLTGAKVLEIHPFRVNNGSLGQVVYASRGNMLMQSIQNTLASIAPMITGLVSEYALINLLLTHDIGIIARILIYYTMVSIVCHMRLSKRDLIAMRSGLPIFLILIFILIYMII